MTTPTTNWVGLQSVLIPSPAEFLRHLDEAKKAWLTVGQSAGPEALSPFAVLGRLVLVVRNLPRESRRDARRALAQYSREVTEALSKTGSQSEQALSQALDYKIGVPEDIMKDLTQMPSEQVRDNYSIGEIEDEFSGFIEYATFVLEGLRSLHMDRMVRAIEERLTRLHDEWAAVAPKVVSTFPDAWTAQRVNLMKSSPPEF